MPLIGQIPAGVPLDAVERAEDSFWLPQRLVGGTSTDEATVKTPQRLDGHAHHDQIHAPGLFTLGHGVPGDSS
ncbi:MAG TPA: hypothetical protein VGH77_07360 [Streptosporangiaceae bacterium]